MMVFNETMRIGKGDEIMKRYRFFAMICMMSVLVLLPAASSLAAKIQYVDKTNWETLKGLMPETSLKWVKSGDMVVQYGTLDYDPAKVMPEWVLESKQENIGKYKLDKNKAIVEAATGKTPKFIKGIPFPDVKRNDPDGPAKVMWNTLYMRDSSGSLHNELQVKFMGRKAGLERSIWVDWYSKPFDGFGPARTEVNRDDLEFASQIVVRSPFDMAGTAMMTWRYRTAKEDMLYGYVPAIRRVRRMTPAARSDALFGSDYAQDDASYGGYDGAINYFNWKFIGEGEVIGAFVDTKTNLITQNKVGQWVLQMKGKDLPKWSYEKKLEKNSGAPWFVDSAVWAKRPVWIIEGIPKDPYYNYGRQVMYIDKETNLGYWKVIYDRTGKYWKTLWYHWANGQDAGKTMNLNAMMITTIVDERANHATAQEGSKNYRANSPLNSNQFSLGGFTAVCK